LKTSSKEIKSRFCDLVFCHCSKAREELKAKRGEAYSYPVLAFHGTAVTNITPICENGFKVPGQDGFQHATDSGFYGRGAYFSVKKLRKREDVEMLI